MHTVADTEHQRGTAVQAYACKLLTLWTPVYIRIMSNIIAGIAPTPMLVDVPMLLVNIFLQLLWVLFWSTVMGLMLQVRIEITDVLKYSLIATKHVWLLCYHGPVCLLAEGKSQLVDTHIKILSLVQQ